MAQMGKTIECVDVLAKVGKKFLIIERLSEPTGLALPGGKVDAGEKPEDAARRESLEETGFAVDIRGIIGRYDGEGRDPRGAYVSTAFYGLASGTPKDEPDKTRILLLTEAEIRTRGSEFVADHFQIFCDGTLFLQ